MVQISFEQIKNSPEINAYIRMADQSLKAMGYTEHSAAHVTRCATTAYTVLSELGYDAHTCELARIAGYMHDIGNVVNRVDHAQSGAVMAFRILDKMGMSPDDIAEVICAIGNHDEATASAVSAVAAALILADKSDVRRTRVRNWDPATQDIHDRVNYAVEHSSLDLDPEKKSITLSLSIDTAICSVMDYFEIFLQRMILCRRAADFLGLLFRLVINDTPIL